MRIINDRAEEYIAALASSLGKDPASLDNWRCIHIQSHNISPVPYLEVNAAVLNKLKTQYKNVDCDIIICRDEDVLLIGRSSDLSILENIQTVLTEQCRADEKPEVKLYDLFYGWREVRKALLAKTPEGTAIIPLEPEIPFIDTAALQDIFRAAQKRRKARNPIHILLVEDDELTRKLTSNLFKENYAVLTAKDAQEAIMNYLLHAPDIVFLDINLPDHNGFQVLKEILAHDPGAYVVMFSGNNYLDNITHALNAGASGFVGKPFSKDKMRHYIEDCAFANQKNG